MEKATCTRGLFWGFVAIFVTTGFFCPKSFASNSLNARITAAQDQWREGSSAFWGEAIPNHPDQARFPEERLQYILDRLVYVSPLRGYDIRAIVIPKASINAQTDGKKILVHTGLLNAFGQNDHQIAAVLAHELAHIIAHHHAGRSEQNKSSLLVQAATPLLSLVPYGSYASLGVRELSNVKQAGYSRDQEKEADAIATILTMEAGYSHLGLTQFLEGVSSRAGTKFAVPTNIPVTTNVNALAQSAGLYLLRASPLYKTHPPSNERATVIHAVAARRAGDLSAGELTAADPWIESVYQVIQRRRPKNRGRA